MAGCRQTKSSFDPGAGSKGVGILLLMAKLRTIPVAHVEVEIIKPLGCVTVKLIV